MRILDMLFVVRKRLWSHKVLTLLLICLEVFALQLFGIVYFCNVLVRYAYQLMDDSFYGGIDNCVTYANPTTYMDSSIELDNEFCERIAMLPEVRGVGDYYWVAYTPYTYKENDTIEVLNNMAIRQNRHALPIQSGDDEAYGINSKTDHNRIFRLMCFTESCYNVYNLNLYSGDAPHIDDIEKSNIHLLYLGYNYRDIPIGTEIIVDDGTGKLILRVAGIFDKNSYIFSGEVILGRGENYGYRIDLDNTAIEIVPGRPYYENNSFYSVSDGYTQEEARLAVDNLAKSMGIENTHQTLLRDRARGVFAQAESLRDVLSGTHWVTIVSVFLTILTVQLLLSLLNMKEYGIQYVNGLSKKTLSFSVLLENLFKGIIAYCVGYYFVYRMIIQEMQFQDEAIGRELTSVMGKQVSIVLFLLMVLISILASVIPIISLYSLSESRMVKGDWR